jgi:hypothetical protein
MMPNQPKRTSVASALGQAILWLNLGTAIFVGIGTGSFALAAAALCFSALVTLLSLF